MPQAPSLTSRLDARAWRSLAAAFVTFGGVGLVFLFGARLMGVDGAGAVRNWLGVAAGGPWALPATVAMFAALAFVGVPQVVLIAAAVFALGPWAGMAYSWAGTLVSSLVGFWLGRRFGASLLRDWAGPRVARFIEVVARNGFMASLLIRLAPSAPFIFVNMAAGVARVRLLDFAAGTAVGIAPKILLTGMAGRSLLNGGRGGHPVLTILISAAGWVALSVVGFVWMRRSQGGADV